MDTEFQERKMGSECFHGYKVARDENGELVFDGYRVSREENG